jgi:PAS domain-containing protein
VRGEGAIKETDIRDLPTPPAIVINSKGYIVGWNEGAEEVLGFKAEQVIGRASHHVLCGRDPDGRAVCHPWCALSPADAREDPDNDIVLYPRSATREVVRVTLSVLRVGGTDPTVGWLVHLITSAKPVPTEPRVPWYADPAWAPRRSSPSKPINGRRATKAPKVPYKDRDKD